MRAKLFRQWWILNVRLRMATAYVAVRVWWHQSTCPHFRHYPDIDGQETCRECDAPVKR